MPTLKRDHINVLLLGGGAREHALAEALLKDPAVKLYAIAHNYNPGIDRLATDFDADHTEKDVAWITRWAVDHKIDFCVVGLEDPLEVGLPDALASVGIPTVGPTRRAANLETSKLFLRELMKRHNIPGQVGFHYFEKAEALKSFLTESDREYALKPIGLTAGKGVKVMGVQLRTRKEAIAYGEEIIQRGIGGSSALVVEERVIGPEFTLQAFVDGQSLVPMPLVKDFKLAYEGDQGPNTGSMGSYSQANGLLPFVSQAQRDSALLILEDIVSALRAEGVTYKGIMYGQFCMTESGPKIIEINARFGDPEAINVLALLETTFTEVCKAIINGRLHGLDVRFAPMATVCRYITPFGYPINPEVGSPLHLDEEKIRSLGVKIYYAKVDQGQTEGEVLTTTSRSLAFVAVAPSVSAAESKVSEALLHVHGRFHVRQDIGKGVPEHVFSGA